MINVSASEYPVNRSWEEKANSSPIIPYGNESRLFALKRILSCAMNQCPLNQTLTFDGSYSALTIVQLYRILQPSRLVRNTKAGWVLSPEAVRWLETGDTLYLAAIFCANIKFLTEILFYLNTPCKVGELYNIAIRDYGFTWKTKSAVIGDLAWLKEFGLIAHDRASQYYSLTDIGKNFLRRVKVIDPARLGVGSDGTQGEAVIPVSKWAITLCEHNPSGSAERKTAIGFIPGPGRIGNFADAIVEYLVLIGNGRDKEFLYSYAEKRQNGSAMQINSFLTVLLTLGFIKQNAQKEYATTELANQWLQKKLILDLVCCFHRKYAFVFEMLHELSVKSRTYKELTAIAKSSYGFAGINIEQISKRLRILKTAGLICSSSSQKNKYVLTDRGRRLLKSVPLQMPSATMTQHTAPENYNYLFTKLRVAPDTVHRIEFRRAVEESFQALGFTVSLQGKYAMIRTPDAHEDSFTALVYVKTTTTVDFEKLNRHREEIGADYLIVVMGHGIYHNLIDRSLEYGAALLTTADLEKLIIQQRDVPIKISSYRRIFEKNGIVDISLLEQDRKETARTGLLMRSIMKHLLTNRTGSALTASDIYWSIRSTHAFGRETPKVAEVAAMLDFLALPIINCTKKIDAGYCATGSLVDLEQRLAFYVKSCKQ